MFMKALPLLLVASTAFAQLPGHNRTKQLNKDRKYHQTTTEVGLGANSEKDSKETTTTINAKTQQVQPPYNPNPYSPNPEPTPTQNPYGPNPNTNPYAPNNNNTHTLLNPASIPQFAGTFVTSLKNIEKSQNISVQARDYTLVLKKNNVISERIFKVGSTYSKTDLIALAPQNYAPGECPAPGVAQPAFYYSTNAVAVNGDATVLAGRMIGLKEQKKNLIFLYGMGGVDASASVRKDLQKKSNAYMAANADRRYLYIGVVGDMGFGVTNKKFTAMAGPTVDLGLSKTSAVKNPQDIGGVDQDMPALFVGGKARVNSNKVQASAYGKGAVANASMDDMKLIEFGCEVRVKVAGGFSVGGALTGQKMTQNHTPLHPETGESETEAVNKQVNGAVKMIYVFPNRNNAKRAH